MDEPPSSRLNMDIKEIVGKELAGEDVTALTKDFTDEQKKEYNKVFISQSEEEKKKKLNEITGLRTAKAALEQKNGTIEAEQNKQFQEKARGEQLVKARSKFIADFGLTEEQTKRLDEEFKTVDSGKIDADLIYVDLKKAYATANADTLIEAEKQKKILEKNAADFNADAAGGGNSGGGGSQGKQYSPAAYEAVKQAKAAGIPLTLDQAESGLKFGKDWKVI